MYKYPIDYDLFNKDEIVKLVEFFALIEDANEHPSKITREQLVAAYKQYSRIVNSKSLEKEQDKKFEQVSGYSIYKTMKNFK